MEDVLVFVVVGGVVANQMVWDEEEEVVNRSVWVVVVDDERE